MSAIANAKIVHADLSPANILLGLPVSVVKVPTELERCRRWLPDSSSVVIIDFGEACSVGDQLLAGTPGFYDEGATVASVEYDIYAFACIALFLFVEDSPNTIFLESTAGESSNRRERHERAEAVFGRFQAEEPLLAGLFIECLDESAQGRPSWRRVKEVFEERLHAGMVEL